MSDLRPDGPELSEQDLAIAALVGRYIERRERHQTPCVHDLLAAAESGDTAVDVLRIALATYEAMRLYGAAPARTAAETADPADAPPQSTVSRRPEVLRCLNHTNARVVSTR
jgi:hypothetical protein